MGMELDETNRRLWHRRQVTHKYAGARSLYTPEAVIFIKHRDAFWQKRVLDVGCGTGRTTWVLKHCAAEYRGIDYSEGMVALCRELHPSANVSCGDARQLAAVPSGHFDFLLCSFNGLDYMDHADRLRALGEFRRVLKPAGLLVFSSHNARYRDARRPPRLVLGRNPLHFPGRVWEFLHERAAHRRHRGRQVFGTEYSIINDSAHGYSLLSYYIDRGQQEAQLAAHGFRVREAYDPDGNLLAPGAADEHAAWIYYVSAPA